MKWIKKIKSIWIKQSNPLIKRIIDEGLSYMWPTDLKEMEAAILDVEK